jgi:alpha-tubulin suppressor-like RCC1 family protein
LGQTNRKEISAPLQLPSLSGRNVVAVDAGSDFSVAIDKSGTLLSWGSNTYSQVSDLSLKFALDVNFHLLSAGYNTSRIKKSHGRKTGQI